MCRFDQFGGFESRTLAEKLPGGAAIDRLQTKQQDLNPKILLEVLRTALLLKSRLGDLRVPH